MTLMTLKKLGKNVKDFIPITMKIKIFVWVTSNVLCVLIAHVMVSPKEVRLTVFV